MNFKSYHHAIIRSHSDVYDPRGKLASPGYKVLFSKNISANVNQYQASIQSAYRKQINRYGSENLVSINDLGVARSPFIDEPALLKLLIDSNILQVCQTVFPHNFVLHNCRAISVGEGADPASVQFHRDLPYQFFATSRPIAITFLIPMPNCIGKEILEVVPNSNRLDYFEEYLYDSFAYKPSVEGEVLVMDSSCYHRSVKGVKNVDYLILIYSCPIIVPCNDYNKIFKAVSHDLTPPEIDLLSELAQRLPSADNDDYYRQKRIESNVAIGDSVSLEF